MSVAYPGSTPGSRSNPFDEAKRKAYIEILAKTGERALARNHVGCNRTTVASRIEKDPEFREQVEEALRFYRATLAGEVHRRGVVGVDRAIYHNGKVVGFERVYSDRLLIEQVRRHVPAYREQTTVNTTGVVLSADMEGLAKMLPESQDQLREILKREIARRVQQQESETTGS